MEKKDDNKDNITNDNQKSKEENNNGLDDKLTEEYKDNLESGGDTEVDSKNEKISNKQKKIYVGIIILLLLIGMTYFGAKKYENLVYPNLTLYEDDVSGLNKSELEKRINTLVNDINNNKIIIKIDDKEYKVLLSDIIDKLDTTRVKNEMINYGKDKNFIQKFGLIYLGIKRNYNFDIKIDEKYLKEEINKIYKEAYINPIEPTLKVNDDNLKIIKGKNGKSIDKEGLMNKVVDNINSNELVKNDILIKEEYQVIKPKINENDLNGVDYKISSATTYFGGTGYNRELNIVNATNKINGTILMPGDEFSYEEKVSPVELSNGYYLAPVIVNGMHKNAPGGGVCQVSTTLYNAQLKAGIIPIERYNHSRAVSYVQRGLDATLATDSKNLRFKNSYDYPIYIHAYTVDGQITVEFWSNKSVLDGKKYTPVSFVKGNVANTYLYGYNSNGELIYKKFIDTSIYR